MTKREAFERWLLLLLQSEGSCVPAEGETNEAAFDRCREQAFSNDANDPGRATQMGVTIAIWHLWCQTMYGIEEATVESLHAITYTQWRDIVKAFYWDMLPIIHTPFDCIAVAIADYYWHSGGVAVRDMQRELGCTPDGIVGPQTKARLRHCVKTRDNARTWVARYNARRLARLGRLPQAPHYINGWTRRVSALNAAIYDLDLNDDERKARLKEQNQVG